MKVSIITPVYNSEKFIRQSIDSVISQTYKNWEMILVDDCSTDNSEEIIRQYMCEDNRIKYIKLKENSGAAVARNTAIENSTGRFIAFLDSDDIWKKDKLQKQIDFMLGSKIGFSFTGYETIKEDGIYTGNNIRAPKCVDYNYLLKNTIIGCLTVMVDKEIIGDIRMPLIRTRQDFATWLSILKKGHKAYGLDEILAEYRLVEGSISSNKIKAAKRNWYVYREIEQLSLLKSAYVFTGYIFNAIMKRMK
ncbi:glycosyltransferase family 2 protein [Romboutsia sp.]|uniref:glycosyltransferase family 2 protein n=1 Tax=Romboutsia sp. TaxID=1965302 RepID=UPI002F3E2BA7